MLEYKSYVGPSSRDVYYENSSRFFLKIIKSGLKPHHKVIDIGCGSIRVGRNLIPYLDSNNYIGLEPKKDMVQEALKWEISKSMLVLKNPKFIYNEIFNFEKHEFDFAIASQVFIHCGVNQLHKCLENLKTKRLLISVRIGDVTEEKTFKKENQYEFASHQKVTYSENDFLNIISKYGYDYESIENEKEIKWFLLNKEESKKGLEA